MTNAMSREEIDNHRREVLNRFCSHLTQHKDFVNTTTSEIEETLISDRDKMRFSEEDMTKGLRTWLRKQKGISPLPVKDMWEIKPPLQP